MWLIYRLLFFILVLALLFVAGVSTLVFIDTRFPYGNADTHFYTVILKSLYSFATSNIGKTVLISGITLFIILAFATNYAEHKYNYDHDRISQQAFTVLSEIEKTGYKWASEWYFHGMCHNIYISAKYANVIPIGHLPSGTILYEADSGEKFYWHGQITHAVIDICHRVHISDDKMCFLAIDDDKLIVPAKTYIIRDPNEMQDFIVFYHALVKHEDPLDERGLLIKKDYHWDTDVVDDMVEARLRATENTTTRA